MPRAFDRLVPVADYDPTREGSLNSGQMRADMTKIWQEVLDQLAGNTLGLMVEALETLLGIDMSALTSLIETLDFSSPEAFIGSIIELLLSLPELIFDLAIGLIGSGAGLLGDDSPLDAANLFGSIGEGLLALIPFSHIGDAIPNLLTNPTFQGGLWSSSTGIGSWNFDDLIGRTTPGSAFVIADGNDHQLRSNAIPVSEGQQLDMSMYTMWEDLEYGITSSSTSTLPVTLPFVLGGSVGGGVSSAGTPIKLQVVQMQNGATVGTDDLDAPAVLTADQSWLQLGGEYTVPAGVDRVALQLAVTEDASAGTVWFDEGDAHKTGLMQIPWVDGLPPQIQKIQDIIDTVWQSLTGFSDVDNLLEDLFTALQEIPFLNVLGIGGPANIGGSMQSTWDQLISGLVGVPGTGASLANLYNVPFEVSSWASLGREGWDILGIRNNRSFNTGFNPTTESTIGLDKVALQSSAPTFAITQSTAITGYSRVSQAEDRAVVSWQGYGATNITDCYINIYKMNTTTGVNALVHASTNQVGLLSGGSVPVPVIYTLPSSVPVAPGEVYGVEIAVRGTGTHNIAGSPTWLQDQATYPRRYSSVRNSSTAPPPSSFTPTYGSNVPFIEFGVSATIIDTPHSDTTVVFNTAGSATTAIPSWCNFIDVVALGGGGGGQGCGFLWGEGGDGGHWNSQTLHRGTEIPTSTVILNVIVGAGGTGSSGFSAPGGFGGASTVNGIGWGGLSAAGGAGGDDETEETAGKSPGNYTHNGVLYVGGMAQDTYRAAGAAPGGGGAGSNFSFTVAGAGASGSVAIVFRQS